MASVGLLHRFLIILVTRMALMTMAMSAMNVLVAMAILT